MISVIVTALAIGVFAPQAPPAETRIPGAEDRLAELEARIVDGLFQHSPWLARRHGSADHDLGSLWYQRGTAVRWGTFLAEARREIARIPSAGLPLPRQFDLAWLDDWTHVESIRALSFPTEKRDPAWIVAGLDELLRAIGNDTTANDYERTTRLALLLERIPAIWDSARAILKAPSRAWSREAALRTMDLCAWMEVRLPACMVASGWSPEERIELGRRQREALKATIAFREWLFAGPAESGTEAYMLGRESWEELARSLSGTESDAETLRSALLLEVAELAQRIDRVPTNKGPTGAGEDARSTVLATWAATRTLFKVAGLELPASDLPNPALRMRASYAAPGRIARLSVLGDGQIALEIEPAGDAWPPQARAHRRTSLSTTNARVLALRHGFPGEALFLAAVHQQEQRTRSDLWNRSRLEGWGLYALDWVPRLGREANPIARDTALKRALLQARREEASRLLATIELHALGMKFAPTIEAYRRRTGVPREVAGVEVLTASRDPLYGLGYLGYLATIAQERRLAAVLGEKNALYALLPLLLSHPATPPAALVETLEKRLSLKLGR